MALLVTKCQATLASSHCVLGQVQIHCDSLGTRRKGVTDTALEWLYPSIDKEARSAV